MPAATTENAIAQWVEGQGDPRYVRAVSKAAASSYVDRIARIRIRLDHLKPEIWREVEVPLSTTLRGLHEVIQAVMLFESRHLFQFDVAINGDERRYGIPDPEFNYGTKTGHAKNIKLSTLVGRGVTRFAYTYDFGDSWEHTITIEVTAAADPMLDYPRFIAGERRAPPEDVGGTPGFEEFVDAIAKTDHPERERLIEWYGRVFDPDDIGLPVITTRLAKLARRRMIGKAAFAKTRGTIS